MKNILLLAAAVGSLFLVNFGQPVADHHEKFTDRDSTETTEFMEWSEMKLDGKTFMISSKSKIKKLIGVSDSTVEFLGVDLGCGHYYDRTHTRHYVKGCEFEQVGDSMVFMLMKFPEAGSHFLKYKKIKLSSATTLNDIKARFPQSTATIAKKEWKGKMYDLVLIPSGKKNSENNWAFYFDNGKLALIRYWISC